MTFRDSSLPAIEAVGLSKRYGETQALRDVSFAVPRGSILGLLGPNGSGKSTTVRALTTLLRPDAGTGRINGIDVLQEPERARTQFGLAGQYASVDEMLSGRNNLVLIGQLYQLPSAEAKRRADDLLERFDLTEAAGRLTRTYSGGMRRRLDLAASLVASPPVLFLDEPTTGLDPRSRLAIWGVIQELVRSGSTVLLTTQYLEEADALAERIVVIDRGRVIANDTPLALKTAVGAEQVVVTLRDRDQLLDVHTLLRNAGASEATVKPGQLEVSVPVASEATLPTVMRLLTDRDIPIRDITVHRPTLDDVFLQLTNEHEAPSISSTGIDRKEVA